VLLTGYFQGEADFGGFKLNATDSLDQDAFVAKMDANGNFMWAKRLGGISIDKGTAIEAIANGDIYVHGTFAGSAWFGQQKLVSAGGEDLFLLRMASDGSVGGTEASSPELALLRAWPNPTNSNIQIGFELSRGAVVGLSILDLQGRIVAQPLHATRMGTGQHTMQVDCSTWPAGLYFYQLELEGRSHSGKFAVTH
jgi:hypothetical protein